MKIAIVDDQKICRTQLKAILNNYEKSYRFEIYEFESGTSLLQSSMNYDLIFLDIEMPGIDGISLANKIISLNDKVLIFYITSHVSLVTKAINNYAFTFIPKPINQEDLFLEMNRALEKLKMSKRTIALIIDKAETFITINKIKYIEVLGKECILHMVDKSNIVTNERLCNIIKKLNEYGFVQCHKGFVINLNYILEIKQNQIMIKACDKLIPIGRKYDDLFKEKLNKFMAGICL